MRCELCDKVCYWWDKDSSLYFFFFSSSIMKFIFSECRNQWNSVMLVKYLFNCLVHLENDADDDYDGSSKQAHRQIFPLLHRIFRWWTMCTRVAHKRIDLFYIFTFIQSGSVSRSVDQCSLNSKDFYYMQFFTFTFLLCRVPSAERIE